MVICQDCIKHIISLISLMNLQGYLDCNHTPLPLPFAIDRFVDGLMDKLKDGCITINIFTYIQFCMGFM